MIDLQRRNKYNMIKTWRQHWPELLFILMLCGCVILSAYFLLHEARRVDSSSDALLHTLVIDPGHGGIDGGAVSDDGTKESDLNLAIGLKLQAATQLIGIPVEMTRSDDAVSGSFDSYSEHEDLVARTARIEAVPGAILISIHQNDFPTGQPSGPQVFYAANPGSEDLGKRCHQNLLTALDPRNRRLAAPVPRNLYITSHVTCPAILVECGFMSNNYDVQKLCDDHYQKSIALVLAASLLQYLEESKAF